MSSAPAWQGPVTVHAGVLNATLLCLQLTCSISSLGTDHPSTVKLVTPYRALARTPFISKRNRAHRLSVPEPANGAFVCGHV